MNCKWEERQEEEWKWLIEFGPGQIMGIGGMTMAITEMQRKRMFRNGVWEKEKSNILCGTC